jgi:hypothetical protein
MENEIMIAIDYNFETGETTERQLNVDEIANRQASQIEFEAKEKQAQAKAEARETALAKLAALGLTQEEIEAL